MIFVFGSNEKGQHFGGAAKVARLQHGAEMGKGFGPHGDSFAIPTCAKSTSEPGFEISIDLLKFYIDCFIMYAEQHPELEFQITQIGCGLAGWTADQVAPLFLAAPSNCQFDSAWTPFMLPDTKYWGTF